jgi:hypothetical protein
VGFNDIKPNPLNTHSTLPRNCKEVYLAGNQLNGYYFINGTTGTTETVFCDFTQSPSSRGIQQTIITLLSPLHVIAFVFIYISI